MDKIYNHKLVEDKIYKEWEEKGYFKPEVHKDGKPYCIILPPPNANGDLHFGHAMFVVEDILVRYHRMKGFSTLWLPGTDHAGIETQFVFEQKLRKEGKSRLDYSQEELYKMIAKFVDSSKGKIQNQLRKLGFSLDWSREKYTLDPDIVQIVYKTFKQMYEDGLVYRAKRLVNYCTKDGTSFSDLEVVYEERKDPLYYIKYGPLVLATTRPETKFGDTGVAVHPMDKRYQQYIGKEIEIETVLGKATIKVVADNAVDPEFGTGVVKVTPAHDFTDFEIGARHNLPLKQVIDFDGKLNKHAGKFAGLYVAKARQAVVEEMEKKGLIEKIDENYVHRIGICYKCKTVIEPLPLEQWFVKVDSLKKKAIDAVKKGDIKLYPKRFEIQYYQWLENLRDWNISRQIVWGIRIPAWFCSRCHPELVSGSQSNKIPKQVRNDTEEEETWIVTDGEKPEKCPTCGSTDLKQDTDTFDTWFSSGQWPFATLMSSSKSNSKYQKSKIGNEESSDFEKFYPTSVMETGYDIIKSWVSRMVMMGLYATKDVPFRHVVLHGLVNDPYGKKMSKSKGNVVNPLELIEQYGADAVRFALIYGTALGNDQSLSYPKLEAARKFTNKLWNIGRFIEMKKVSSSSEAKQSREVSDEDSSRQARTITIQELLKIAKHENDKEMVKKVDGLVKQVTKDLDAYNLHFVAENLYDFTWHTFADKYIEDVKNRIDENSSLILTSLYLILLKLLHPIMPFVTEELWSKFPRKTDTPLIISQWPQ